MTLDEYKKNILIRMGAPLLDIEVEANGIPTLTKNPPSTSASYNFLSDIINSAFMELREYIDTVHFKSLPYSNRIDLSEYNVRAVVYVLRGTLDATTASQNTDALLFSPLTTMMTQTTNMGYSSYSSTNLLQNYMSSLIYKQVRNTLNQDLDYTYDRPTKNLYIFQQVPRSDSITIAYHKDYKDVSEIEDPYWINWMLRIGLAYTKEVVGRIRSKYKLNSAPYELDGEELLSESQTELSEIRQFLSDNNNLFLPMD